jgi:integrase
VATFRKRGDRWQVRIQRNGHQALSKSFLNRLDAEKWGRLTESELERGLYICPAEAQRTTLADALDRYERDVSALKKSKHVEKYYIQHWRNSKLAPLALSAIRGVDVAGYRDTRLKAGLSTTSVKHELALLSHLFAVASREWGMESLGNPVQAIRQPAIARGRERRVSDAEVDAVCQLLNQERSACVRLALHSAMRRGELLKLRWADFDFARSVVILNDTKNGDRREVPLSAAALAVVSALVRRIDGRVFAMTDSGISHAFLAAVRQARKEYEANSGTYPGFLVDLHFHDLRHEAASRLVEQGFHPLEVMAITGHRDTRMLKRYVHPRAEELAKKMQM